MCLALLVLVSCADPDGDGATYEGRVSEAAQATDTGDRWVVTVVLDGAQVAGSEIVQVAFDAVALKCADGTSLRPDEIDVDDVLTFVRVGDGVDTMAPPIIAGSSMKVSC